MIERPALDQIHNATSAERVTFILCWTAQPDLSAAEAAPSRRERTEAARQAYSAIKQDFVEELERVGDVSVQDLPGTANALATATAGAWLGVAPLLASRMDVNVVPNQAVAFAPGTE